MGRAQHRTEMFQRDHGLMGSPRRPQMWWMQNEKCGDENWLAEASCVLSLRSVRSFSGKKAASHFSKKTFASFDALNGEWI